MNKANLKSYAPKARLDFIKAVTERANVLGISAAGVVPAEVRGDVALIDGREWPAKVASQRDELIARIKRHGFEQTMDEVAYTWFNRFAALRYMEIHDYLGHGWRVLSSRDGGLPEILRHASEVTLPGLNPDRAREMQLAGNQDNELYKLLLVAQCNELSRVMPFLFERIDDESELLLPENLLRTDSIVVKLVEQVPEEDWQEIEVIGWLYQFYISERKALVIGKVVATEDIPAATQLFTPNWIVKYMVQNSIGRIWLMCNPSSELRSRWTYLSDEREQSPHAAKALAELASLRIHSDGETLNPETLTLLDPACGSGHILVEAYEVFKAIYLERGYRLRDIPRLILERNLFGLDIDKRAAQLAGFAILMKARADDRRILERPVSLSVIEIISSESLDVDLTVQSLSEFGVQRHDVLLAKSTLNRAKALGSLVVLPDEFRPCLTRLLESAKVATLHGDLYARSSAIELLQILAPAALLARAYDAVVANPPYMGSRNMNDELKAFLQKCYPDSRADIYAAFIERGLQMTVGTGIESMVAMETWMFLSSYGEMRQRLVANNTIESLVHMPYDGKGRTSMGINFGTAAFALFNQVVPDYSSHFQCIRHFEIGEDGVPLRYPVNNERNASLRQSELQKIPGSPIAYWVSEGVRSVFTASRSMSEVSQPRQGLATGDNGRFVRFWHEVSVGRVCFNAKNRFEAAASGARWFPHLKGGDFRKWYGNQEFVVNWEGDGEEIRNFKDEKGKLRSRPQGLDSFFLECISWSDVTSASNSFRLHASGFIPNVIAPVVFEKSVDLRRILLAANNVFFNHVIKALNPTLHFHIGYFSDLPYPTAMDMADLAVADELVSIAREDWNSSEVSWDFNGLSWVNGTLKAASLEESWTAWREHCADRFARTKALETQNNQFFLNAYAMTAELSPDVPDEEITLERADCEKDAQRLISYAIGCVTGRYSLRESGLIYALAGNEGFDPNRYDEKFPADADGIVPISEELWFEDDAAIRIRQFVGAVWGADALEVNMAWLAGSLGAKGGETPDETIRRYLTDKFYKDHLQTYRRRPIYWLFRSGKQGAFQALVYLHRYNDGTLARMRAEYVVPLIAKMASRLDMLEKDAVAALSSAARTKLQKQIEVLRKKRVELLAYDEKLRHYADMRITLDLDDGVKVNYARFGDLVAESKAITGGSDE